MWPGGAAGWVVVPGFDVPDKKKGQVEEKRPIILLNKVAQEINLPQPVTMLKNLSLNILIVYPRGSGRPCRYFVDMAVWCRMVMGEWGDD